MQRKVEREHMNGIKIFITIAMSIFTYSWQCILTQWIPRRTPLFIFSFRKSCQSKFQAPWKQAGLAIFPQQSRITVTKSNDFDFASRPSLRFLVTIYESCATRLVVTDLLRYMISLLFHLALEGVQREAIDNSWFLLYTSNYHIPK